MQHPREIDEQLRYAQEARRVLDRLVGYDLSGLDLEEGALRALGRAACSRRRCASSWSASARSAHLCPKLFMSSLRRPRRLEKTHLPSPAPKSRATKKLIRMHIIAAVKKDGLDRRRCVRGRGQARDRARRLPPRPCSRRLARVSDSRPRARCGRAKVVRSRTHHLHAHRLDQSRRPGARGDLGAGRKEVWQRVRRVARLLPPSPRMRRRRTRLSAPRMSPKNPLGSTPEQKKLYELIWRARGRIADGGCENIAHKDSRRQQPRIQR